MKKGMTILLAALLCALGIGAWGENLPVEEAEEAAYHLMIGDFGYRPEEAAGFRYEGWMEEGSISTYVRVYTDSGQEAYIELCYWNDGTLDEARIDINVPFEYWKRKITEEEAKESARHLLMEKYGYGEDVMEGFRYEAQEQEGIIVVRAYPFEEMEDEYFTLKYHYDGRLSSDEIPDILDFSAYTKEVQETGVPIQFYTHEQRAAYSQIYIPKVEAAGRLNPRSAEVKYHSLFTNHVYGVPTPEDMPEEEAMEIARNALVKEFGCTWDWLRVGSGYFDITDPDAPLWKLLAVHSDEKEVWDRYIVRVNARTGEVVAAFEVTGDTPLEEMY